MTSDLTVHVIDDDDAARESLTFLLRTAKYSVYNYNSAVTFLKSLPSIEGGCIITDLRMPEMSGLDLVHYLKSHANSLPVVVVTGQGDVSLAIEALKAGALDFIEKPYDAESLLGAVRSAFGGRLNDATQDAKRTDFQQKMETLSPVERQVLSALVAGQPNMAVAFDLRISPHAVEMSRASIMTKLQATSLSQLVRLSLLAGDKPPFLTKS